MVPSAQFAQIFNILPQRPPTPPKAPEHLESKSSSVARLFSKKSGNLTPTSKNPKASIESVQSKSNRLRKRVEWSEKTDYEDTLETTENTSTPSSRALRALPPSSDKPPKSILKPYNGVNLVDCRATSLSASPSRLSSVFVKMLESVLHQLAGEDRSSRIDAYLTLNGVLKASDHVPEPFALKERLEIIGQYVLRDITETSHKGTVDAGLAINALTLLASLFWRVEALAFSNDFGVKFMEFAVLAFESPMVSKDIVKHLMYVVANQSFSLKVLSAERTKRLLHALQAIEQHFKGRSIIVGRMAIYQRLLRQNKQAMLNNMAWVEHLLRDMLSTLKDIRTAAITWGMEAAICLGTERQASKAVVDLLDRADPEVEEGKRYFNLFSFQLSEMVAKKHDAVFVPQIWAVVVLFLRSRPQQLEQWEHMRPWLCNIQECFNCSDHEVKIQANTAWNRLIFAIGLSEKTSPSMLKMLCQPLSGQLRRKSPERHALEARKSTFSTLNALIYYSLRPAASTAQLDLLWDEYIVRLVGTMLVKREREDAFLKREDLLQACAILESLFNNSKSVTWSNNRATEALYISAQELPALEPRWIRINSPRIFEILTPLVQKCLLLFSVKDNPIFPVWHALMGSIRAAGLKEVKVSNETMGVIAYLFNTISELWHVGLDGLHTEERSSSTIITAIVTLLDVVIENLGTLPFTEKLLSTSQHDTFIVVATPSHRPSKSANDVRPPLHHLMALIATPSPGITSSDEDSKKLASLITPFFEIKKSKSARFELAGDLSQLLLTHATSVSAKALWGCLANCVASALDYGQGQSSSSNEQPLGVEYRNITKVLGVGAMLYTGKVDTSWMNLFQAISAQVTREAGEAGRAISLVDPLASSFLSLMGKTGQFSTASYLAVLIDCASYPRERQTVDAARRRLWGTTATAQRTLSFDPFLHLYKYTAKSLPEFYNHVSADSFDACAQALDALRGLLRRCPQDHLLEVLANIQEGVVPWLLDSDLKFRSQNVSILYESVAKLWDVICSWLHRLPRSDSSLLRRLAPLVCAGAESKHESIAVTTIRLWNSTFGQETFLDYPTDVELALRRLQSVADIQLPGFPSTMDIDSVTSLPNFNLEKSQQDQAWAPHSFVKSVGIPNNVLLSMRTSSPKSSVAYFASSTPSVSHKALHASDGTPAPSSRKKVDGKLSTPKFRHNDSQIQFEAIESSPVRDEMQVSQILTERQREIKQRQQEEAVLFSDIRSSPRSNLKTPQRPSPLFDLTTTLNSITTPTTPIMNGRNQSPLSESIESSPTPRRGHMNLATMDVNMREMPSSPPERVEEDVGIEVVALPKDPIDYSVLQEGWNAESSPAPISIYSPGFTTCGNYAEKIQASRKKGSTDASAVRHPESMVARDRVTSSRASTPIMGFQSSDALTTDDFVDALSSPTSIAIVHSGEAGAQTGASDDTTSFLGADVDENSAIRLMDEVEKTDRLIAEEKQLESIEESPHLRNKANEINVAALIKKQQAIILQKPAKKAKKTPASRVLRANHIMSHTTATTRSKRNSLLLHSTIPETPGKDLTTIEATLYGTSSAPASEVPESPRRITRDDPDFDTVIVNETVLELVGDETFTGPITRHHSQINRESISQRPNLVSQSARTARSRKRKRRSEEDSEVADSQDKEKGDLSIKETPSLFKKGRSDKFSKKELARRQQEELQASIETQSQGMAEDGTFIQSEDEIEDTRTVRVSRTRESSNVLVFNHVEIVKSTKSASPFGTPDIAMQKKQPVVVDLESLPVQELSVETAKRNSQREEQVQQPRRLTGSGIIAKFTDLLASLRQVAFLSRDEAKEVDTLMWDIKGEICEAEKRGRTL